MNGRPVPAAYVEALPHSCPSCGAGPGEYCSFDLVPGGQRRIRRIPCVARPAPTRMPTPDDRPTARDITEPLHRREVER